MEYHVAPMRTYTNWAFRSTCLGATDSYTEMIQLWELLKEKPRALRVLDLYQIEDQHQWIQVLTNSLKEIKKVPEFFNAYSKKNIDKSNIFGININAGCPDPQIISAGHGSALIKRRKRIYDLAKIFLKNKEHPYCISFKFRLGMNSKDIEMKIIVEVLKHLHSIEDSRLQPSIIHFKHANQNSDDPPDFNILESILETSTPIIINGDITSQRDLENLYENLSTNGKKNWENNLKGIMVGRALLNNPFLFLENFNPKNNSLNNIKKPKIIDWKELLSKKLKQYPTPNYFVKNLHSLF